MKKDVMITIKGTWVVDGQTDSFEMLTCGSYFYKDRSYCVSYEETETTGMAGHRTTVQFKDDVVTMRRVGKNASSLVIEKGCRHQCMYNTDMGSLMVGINGTRINSSLNEKGGELDFSYSMDINSALASENRVIISVKEC